MHLNVSNDRGRNYSWITTFSIPSISINNISCTVAMTINLVNTKLVHGSQIACSFLKVRSTHALLHAET